MLLTLKSAIEIKAASQEFSFMLASPANQLTDAETIVANDQARTGKILALEFSVAEHEPVLLSPGKWNVGSDASNQIVLNSDDIAARQFLIIVTEHRSVIKDWRASALCNGSPFDSAVLGDGDSVDVAGIRLAFRVAESQDLISQLPYVSESNCSEETASATDHNVAPGQREDWNTAHETADGMLSLDDSSDRLDELISRIESSLALEVPEPASLDSDADLAGNAEQEAQPQFAVEMGTADVESGGVVSSSTEHKSELAADRIDEELRQLEELRAAVQLEREQLLAKRGLLIQESQQVEVQIAEAQQSTEFGTADDETAAFDKDGFAFGEQPSNDVGMSVENEDGAVAAEREKLRHYLEEFESVDDAEYDQLEEAEVAVGAAQAVADHNVMNALRSRDDAVRQLDDLVLAATGGLPAQPASPSSPLFNAAANHQPRESSGNFASSAENESEAVGHDHERHDLEASVEDVETTPDFESSVEKIGELIDEVEAAESLAVEELHQPSANKPESLADFPDVEDTVERDEQSPIETAVSEPDYAEDVLTLQSPDIHEVVEEPAAESSVEVDVSEAALDLESEKAELQPTDLESESVHTDPDFQETSPNIKLADAGAPSWFDSKLLAEGDSEVDSESVVDHAVSNDADTEDAVDAETNVSAVDLRQKLPEMFDLPTLSENTEAVSPDTSLEPRLQQFRDEPSTEDVAEVDSDVPSSPWPDATSSETNAESDPGLDFDPSGVSETQSGSEFESETLDAFPTPVADQSADNSATSAGSSFEPEGQVEGEEEEESISVYMERLLARNRQVTGGSAAPAEESSAVIPATNPTAAPESDSAVSSINQDQSADGTVEAASEPEKWLDDTPRHRQNRDQVRAEVQVLRQIANQSARSAVATASRRDVRKQVIVKTTASILALGSGVTALLLDISMPFGLFVLGIGIFFSIDLGLTIFRNWKQLRDLKKATKALEAEVSDVGSTPEPAST
ncbi:MAG: hypothetical protein ACI8P0_001643 [Planctomycetaceae bacterium]|jgi:hypothetical protein